jgi:molybdate transport system substrate-binding protein
MIASCAQEDGRAEAPRETELVVFAASSLRDVFTEMAASFERAHGGAHVTFNFAGTQELRTQLEHGAPVDVFASADTRHMEELVEARRVGAARVFARNEPVVAVSREATRKIRAFGDLPIAARIVLGAPDVPIGRYSQQILDRAEPGFRARVEAKVASRELNVRQVLAKVALGEADAGIVYRTDVPAGDERVSVVAIPPEVNVIAAYPIAVVANAAHPGLARAWMDLVMSEDSQRALADGGFLPPVR